ncbi:7346_t:CDS:1, partial [Gigaspora margarita]
VEIDKPTSDNKELALLEVDSLSSLLFLLSLDLDILGFGNAFDFFDLCNSASKQANIFSIF